MYKSVRSVGLLSLNAGACRATKRLSSRGFVTSAPPSRRTRGVPGNSPLSPCNRQMPKIPLVKLWNHSAKAAVAGLFSVPTNSGVSGAGNCSNRRLLMDSVFGLLTIGVIIGFIGGVLTEKLRNRNTKEGTPSTSTNSSMVAICAYHKPGWSCPFHAGVSCDSNGCNEAPRIQCQ